VTSTPRIPIAEPSPTVIMPDVRPYAERKPDVSPKLNSGDDSYNYVFKEEHLYRPYAAVKPDPLFPENEQKACIMLSYLFLDIRQDEDDVNYLAREIQPLGLSAADIDRLFYYDVFPIVWANLFTVAGDWFPFDGEWLLEAIAARRKWAVWRWVTSPVPRIMWLMCSHVLFDDLENVKKRIMELEDKAKAACGNEGGAGRVD
jgi:hypothetical protein